MSARERLVALLRERSFERKKVKRDKFVVRTETGHCLHGCGMTSSEILLLKLTSLEGSERPFRGAEGHFGHVRLSQGERSPMATMAAALL